LVIESAWSRQKINHLFICYLGGRLRGAKKSEEGSKMASPEGMQVKVTGEMMKDEKPVDMEMKPSLHEEL
jgi:hypothetical protein